MKWHELEPKAQRKALILAALVAGALLVLIWPAGVSLQRSPARRQAPKTAPGKPGPVVHAAPQIVPAPPPAKDAGLLGKWQSVGLGAQVANHGLCTLWLEIARKADEPDKYTGAASLSCIPTTSLTAPKLDTPITMMLAERDPLFASMSGAWEKDALVFRMDKVLNPKACGLSGFSVSRFGSQNLAAEFQDGCGGGSMVLRKTG
jgi:hypothetical protein